MVEFECKKTGEGGREEERKNFFRMRLKCED